MFTIYFALVLVPLYVLYRGLQTPGRSSHFSRFVTLASVTITMLIGIPIVVSVFRSIFSFSTLPIGVPGFTEVPVGGQFDSYSIYSNIFRDFGTILLAAEVGLLVITGLAFVAIVAVHAIKAKESKEEYSLLENIKANIKLVFRKSFANATVQTLILASVAFLCVLLQTSSFLNSENTFSVSRGVDWGRLGAIVLLVYTTLALLIYIYTITNAFTFWFPSKRGSDILDRMDSAFITSLIFYGFLSTIVSYYALRAYPFIPQQIGGGKPIQVQIETKSIDLSDNLDSLYLVDSASNSLILMGLYNDDLRVFSVPSEEILLLEFIQEITEQ